MWAIFTKEINKYFKRKEKDPLVQSRLHLRLHIVFQSKLGSTWGTALEKFLSKLWYVWVMDYYSIRNDKCEDHINVWK